MTTVVMMYVIPMLLGQTYDLGKEKPGLMIYPMDVMNESVRIEHYFTDSQYRMVENSAEMKDFLDVSGKLSLKIKSGMVNIAGEGSYLKDSSSKTDGMEILVKVHFETVTFTIPTSKQPNADWTLQKDEFLGTHYCRSVTFGGDLVASIRVSSSSAYDLMRIKAALNGGLKTSGGGFEGDIKGKLELLKQTAQDSSSLEINYYASVPIHGVSYSIEGLINLIDNFPKHVKKVNGGFGNPLRMELFPLNSLRDSYPAYFENSALTDTLDDLENQFDDLRDTRKQLGNWIAGLPPALTDSLEKKIDAFATKVNKIYAIYVDAIDKLDLSKGASTKPIQDAFDAYKDGDYVMFQKYIRQFRSLQREVYKEDPDLLPKVNGAYYVHWGRRECSNSTAELALSGVIVASEIKQDGGSSDFLCSPLDLTKVKPENYFDNYDSKKDNSEEHLLVSPIRYKGSMKSLKPMHSNYVSCALCKSGPRTAQMIKSADRTCPKGWVKEYEGYLMAPGTNAKKGEFICIDVNMEEPREKPSFGNEKGSHLQEVQEVSVTCGSLPCGPYQEKKTIACVVCTI